MKKTSNRVIAMIVAVAIVLSGIAVAAVALTSFALNNNLLSNGSAVLNANSVEEAIELMKQNSDTFFAKGKNSLGAEQVYPTVILPGISQSVSYLADENGDPFLNANGDELSGGLLIIDEAALPSVLVNDLLVPLTRSLINQKDAGLSEGVYNTVKDLFKLQSSNKRGEPMYNLQTISYETSVAGMSQDDRDYFYRMIPMQSITAEVGEDNLYLYAFPLIGDPMESAAGLNDYIQMIKEQKGVDKVNIVTISLGGTILTAYLDLYKDTGYPDVNMVVNVVSCLHGTDIMGDFYLRQWNLEDEFFFHEYIPLIFEESEGYSTYGHLINVAIKIFPKQVVYAILTAAVDGILDTLMLNCPQFWSMIPTDRFDDAKAKYSFIWEDPSYAVLAKKIDRFHTAAVNLDDNLVTLRTNSVNNALVHNLCGYGLDYGKYDYNFFAAMASCKVTNSDAIIDIDSTSLGATYAKAGTILDDEILFRDGAIISPDGSIDASTCLFPNNVWFFQGQHHEVGRNDVVIKLVGKLISNQIKSTADMADAYPQFNGNRNTKNIFRWYLEEAEGVLNAEDKSMYNEDDLIELQEAYDEAKALLETTICEASVAEATSDRLLNALRRVGVRGAAEDETLNKALETIAAFVDDTVYSVFGGNGFSDIVLNGPFGNFKK